MPANDYFDSSSVPGTSSAGESAVMRAEFDAIEAGFNKLPALTGNGNKAVVINGAGTAMTVTAAALALAVALTTAGGGAITLTSSGATNVTLPTTGTLATLAGAEALTNKTITTFGGAFTFDPANLTATLSPTGTGTVTIAPATAGTIDKMVIGGVTPLAGSFTTLSATGALTYGGVTLTSAVTGTGKMVLDTSPTIATPVINSAAHVGGTWVADATWTLPALTLGGTVSGGGQQLNNIIIGTVTPLAGAFTTLSASGNVTVTNGTLLTGAASSALFNTTATTLAIGGAATTLTMGAGAAASATLSFTTGIALNTAAITSNQTTVALLNATATTVNAFGAATTMTLGAATSATTWTGQAWTLTGANSTNNTTLTVTNTSNAAAASHSILDIAVGGTTSTGDPQLRLTIPGGTSWYAGVDNSASDALIIGTGTAVGTNPKLTYSGTVFTVNDNLVVSGTGPHAIGGATSPRVGLRVLPSITDTGSLVGLQVGGTYTFAANSQTAAVIGSGIALDAVTMATGTFTGLEAHVLSLSGANMAKTGTGTINSAATIKISDAPTIGTDNYALWVVAGQSRFGGNVAVYGATPSNLTAAGSFDFSSNSTRFFSWGAAGNDGYFSFFTGQGGASPVAQVVFLHTASADRYITLTGSNGGNPAIGVSAGDLAITPRVGIAGAAIANELDVNGSIRVQGGTRALKFNNTSVEFAFTQVAGAAAALHLNAGLQIGVQSTNNEINNSSTGGGTATLYIGNASINVTSDENLKRNITTLQDGLSIVKALLPIEFDQDEERPFGDVRHYMGFGARHSHKVAPWAVHTQGDTGLPWKMRQEFLMAPVVRAVQQIDERLAALESRLN